MVRSQVVYSGRVQGVGFRATVCAVARSHPVTGWVRNQADGSVMLEAQGTGIEVARFLRAIAERLDRYIVSSQDREAPVVQGEGAFEIRR